MFMSAKSEPDQNILARRQQILTALEQVGPNVMIPGSEEAAVYQCDALTAYRRSPLAVSLSCACHKVATDAATCVAERTFSGWRRIQAGARCDNPIGGPVADAAEPLERATD